MAKQKVNPLANIPVKCVMGIDASYTQTGLSVARVGELKTVLSIKFKNCKTKTDKRALLRRKMRRYIKKYKPDIIVIERTRQFSKKTNDKPNSFFMSMNMIKTGISILTAVIDTGFEFGIPTFSVDTRSWKSQVVGTSKHKTNDKKLETIVFVKSLGFEVYDDDDAADGACISLFYWYAAKKSGEKRRNELLRLEE